MDGPEELSYGGVVWKNGLPTRSLHQSCAVCGANAPQWIHPLDPGRIQYRVYGKGHTLPTFWCLCGRCERLYVRGLDDELLRIMREQSEWAQYRESQVAECVAQSLAVFRRADLGAQRLSK